MITEYIPNYLYSADIDNTQIDFSVLSRECLVIENALNIQFRDADRYTYGGGYESVSYKNYNLFTFPSLILSKLYRKIQEVIYPYLSPQPFMCQAWLNVYREGQYIGWHHHWDTDVNSYHGFYCVDVEAMYSETVYQLKDEIGKDYVIPSRNGRLVFGKSYKDIHASSIWCSNEPRITIAFDIIPVNEIHRDRTVESISTDRFTFNHYIPFK